jgi:hypothetical protein
MRHFEISNDKVVRYTRTVGARIISMFVHRVHFLQCSKVVSNLLVRGITAEDEVGEED